MKTLDELGVLHGTDKSSLHHGYCAIYEPYLSLIRHSARKVLEIGVAGGNSLWMWLEYFKDAMIYGVDHNRKFVDNENNRFHGLAIDRAIVIFGDAFKPSTWDTIKATTGGELDLIVDDGSHYSGDIMAAFRMGWPLLAKGGLYAVEDLHQIWQQEYPHGSKATAFEFFVEKMHEMNEQGSGQCARPLQSDIASIHFYKSLVILRKR